MGGGTSPPRVQRLRSQFNLSRKEAENYEVMFYNSRAIYGQLILGFFCGHHEGQSGQKNADYYYYSISSPEFAVTYMTRVIFV